MSVRRPRAVIVGIGALAAAVGASVLIVISRPSHGEAPLRPDDREVVAAGESVYRAHCASCHGASLEGQPDWRKRRPDGRIPAPPHDATGHTWHHADALLFQITKLGPSKLMGGGYESDMPGYEGVLSDAEIVAVLSYIKSTWPPAVQRRHDALNEQGRSR